MALQRWQGDASVFSAMMIGAVTYPIAQWILLQMDVLFFHTVRFPLLALLFLPFAWKHMPPLQLLPKAALPGIFMWFGIICWSVGVMTTEHMGGSAFIISLQCILAPLLARIFFNATLQPRLLIGLLIATAGLALLTLENGFQISTSNLWMMLSAVLLAMYLVTNSQFAHEFHHLAITWAQFAGSAILCLAAAPFMSNWSINFSWTLMAAMAFMILISTGLRFTLMSLGQKVTTAAGAALILMLEPVMVALIGWLVLGETMTPQQFSGCVLIAMASLFAVPRGNKKAAATA